MQKVLPLTAALLLAGTSFAHAQEYPTRRVTVIAPVPAGTSADAAARIIMKKMSEILGQQFIIENRPGSLGLLGVTELLKADAGGYTLCLCNDGSTLTVMADKLARDKEPPYTPDRFTPIGQAVEVYFVLVVNKDLPVGNFRELVAYIREHPGELNVASASPMSFIVTGLMKHLLGSEAFTEIPYRGDEPKASLDLMSGRIHIMASTSNTALPQIEAGTVKAIGTIGVNRNPYLPNLATLQEQASELKDFHTLVAELRPWNALIGPGGMPPDVVAKLSGALKQALVDPEVVQALQKAKLGIHFGDPKDLEALFDRLPILTNILRRAGTKFLD